MNDLYPLDNLLDIVDQLPIRYLRNRTETLLDGVSTVTLFPGTNVPRQIDAARSGAGTIIYKEYWHCSGEYGCSTGNPNTKRKTRTHHCAAEMQVLVYATAQPQQCLVRIQESPPEVHGAGFRTPPENHRYDWRSKVIIAQAAADGVNKIGDLLSDRYWNEDLVPRPATKNERESVRCRLKQLNAKLAKEKKEEEKARKKKEEEEEAEEDDESEESDEELPAAEPEKVLQVNEAADGELRYLVKWRHWPQSSATWMRERDVPAQLVRAFRRGSGKRK